LEWLSTCLDAVRRESKSHRTRIAFHIIPGYGRQFNGLADYLSRTDVADKIDVVGKRDARVTGNFEVTVQPGGQVLHSKRLAGQGKAETPAERQAILEQIRELLEDEQEL
jgi:hypothetical protein